MKVFENTFYPVNLCMQFLVDQLIADLIMRKKSIEKRLNNHPKHLKNI